ncbi:MAG: LPXTG cell wall anchor domain-containing protein [Oscillospiraceae bacterium]|jgi:hypothetical protein|nr:LPXTG cell wall anchor domain-containing protein [Oscillospiraceae bacterium]
MDNGILSLKIMILGAVIFLAGWEFAFDGSLPATAAFMIVGPAVMLIGLLMGNRKKRKDENEPN